MARSLVTARRALFSYFTSSSKTLLVQGPTAQNPRDFLRNAAVSSFLLQSRPFATDDTAKSAFEANILRLLHNETEYQFEYTPPQKPATNFESFVVEDRPGELWITMRGKFDESEEIKVKVTMFDGYETVVNSVGDGYSSGEIEEVRLHISLLVDISKGDECNSLEFVCSAWPDSIEIRQVYLLERDKVMNKPYLGPDSRHFSTNLQKGFLEFLKARGVNNELSIFLHSYMKNKDRVELIQWFKKVMAFVEK